MPFPFPDNDDVAGQYDPIDPEELPRCRHGIALDEYGSARACEDCNEAAGEAQAISADAAWPFAENF